jgi:TfoX/Sxy family transcriptional regulator of competence genes
MHRLEQKETTTMATDASFVEHVCDQANLRGLTFRKMFGEYALYVDGKVVALACDNSLFLKPTDAARAILKAEPAGTPFPGAKPHYCIDIALDDPPLLNRLLRETADVLPLPKPKAARKPAVKARAPRGSR